MTTTMLLWQGCCCRQIVDAARKEAGSSQNEAGSLQDEVTERVTLGRKSDAAAAVEL